MSFPSSLSQHLSCDNSRRGGEWQVECFPAEGIPPQPPQPPPHLLPLQADCGHTLSVSLSLDTSLARVMEEVSLQLLSRSMPPAEDTQEEEPSMLRFLRALPDQVPDMPPALAAARESFVDILESAQAAAPETSSLSQVVHDALQRARDLFLERTPSTRMADLLAFVPLGMAVHLGWRELVQLVTLALSVPSLRDTRDFLAAVLFLLQVEFLGKERAPLLNITVSACHLVECSEEEEESTPPLRLPPELAMALYYRTAHLFWAQRKPQSGLWYMQRAQQHARIFFGQQAEGHWMLCFFSFQVRQMARQVRPSDSAVHARVIHEQLACIESCQSAHVRALLCNLFEETMTRAMLELLEVYEPIRGLLHMREQEARGEEGADLQQRRQDVSDARQRVVGLVFQRWAEVEEQVRCGVRSSLAQWYARDESITLHVAMSYVMRLLLGEEGAHKGEEQVEGMCEQLLEADLVQWLRHHQVPVSEWPHLVSLKVTSLDGLRGVRFRSLQRAAVVPRVLEALRGELKRPGEVACVVCREALPNVMFGGCRHLCVCSVCFAVEGMEEEGECPVCGVVSGKVREVVYC